jgi:hypothetical protein
MRSATLLSAQNVSMNPFIAALLAADIVGLVAWRRLSNANAGPARVVLGLQALAALCAIASVLADDAAATSWLFWAMLILVNAALGVVALRVGNRGLAIAGGATTACAVALILAHSFSSLPVAGVATVLCLGAALLPPPRAHKEQLPL